MDLPSDALQLLASRDGATSALSAGRGSPSAGPSSRAALALELLRSVSPPLPPHGDGHRRGPGVVPGATSPAPQSPSRRDGRASAPPTVGPSPRAFGVHSRQERRPSVSPLPPRPAAPTPTAQPQRWAPPASPVPPKGSGAEQTAPASAFRLAPPRLNVDSLDDSLDEPSAGELDGNAAALREEEDSTLPPTLARMFDAAVAGTSGGAGGGAHSHRGGGDPASHGAAPGQSMLCIRLGVDGTASVFDARDAPSQSWADEPLFEVRVRGSAMSVASMVYHGPRPQQHRYSRTALPGGAAPALPSWFAALNAARLSGSSPPPGSPRESGGGAVRSAPSSPMGTGARRSIRVRALFDTALGVVDGGPSARASSTRSDGEPVALDLSGRATLRHIANGTLGDALLEAASPHRRASAGPVMSALA